MEYPYRQKKHMPRRMDEHRWLMEEHLGRRLERFEFVHHKNGDKRDNRLANLELVSPKEHAGKHGQQKHPITKRCEVCGKEFTPHPTHRKRARTCGVEHGRLLLSWMFRRPDAPRSIYNDSAYPSWVAKRKPSRKSQRK